MNTRQKKRLLIASTIGLTGLALVFAPHVVHQANILAVSVSQPVSTSDNLFYDPMAAPLPSETAGVTGCSCAFCCAE